MPYAQHAAFSGWSRASAVDLVGGIEPTNKMFPRFWVGRVEKSCNVWVEEDASKLHTTRETSVVLTCRRCVHPSPRLPSCNRPLPTALFTHAHTTCMLIEVPACRCDPPSYFYACFPPSNWRCHLVARPIPVCMRDGHHRRRNGGRCSPHLPAPNHIHPVPPRALAT